MKIWEKHQKVDIPTSVLVMLLYKKDIYEEGKKEPSW